MAEAPPSSSRQRARRRHRRRAVVLALAALIVLAGVGTAWAMSRSSGPRYRLATVRRSDVTQTVDADGTVATVHQASMSFATSGTVQKVRVRDGDIVRAGEVVARLDPSELANAVVSAKQTLATAKQKLASDESAQASTAATSAATTRSSRATVVLTAEVQTTAASNDPAVAAVVRAQRALVVAQRRLDAAVSAEDVAIDAATTACAQTDDTEPVTVSTTADSSGTVQGTVTGEAVTATLLDADGTTNHTTSSSNPQAVGAGGSYRFAGLAPGDSYEVSVVRSGKVIDTTACTSALASVQAHRTAVDSAAGIVDSRVDALTTAVGALQREAGSPTTAPSSGGTSSTGSTGARPSQQPSQQPSTQPSGQTSAQIGQRPSGATSSGGAQPSGASTATGSVGGATGNSTATTVTALQIVADQKSIDAASAALRLARQNRGLAVLRAPIAGTVAGVAVSSGDSVGTSTTALQIVGSGRKSVTVDVSLAKVDLVKAGQRAHVIVDGHTAPLAGRVSQVGLTNTSSSTGSAATYAVTVVLDPTHVRLFDGMGATVSIDVGSVRSTISVPLSAVTTTGQLSTVRVYAGGRVTTTRVTVGVQGSDHVQIKSGLRTGEQVVLAEVSAAIPSSTDSSTQRLGGGGLTGGGFTGGGFTGAGPPGR